jgi:hypothetical protein
LALRRSPPWESRRAIEEKPISDPALGVPYEDIVAVQAATPGITISAMA